MKLPKVTKRYCKFCKAHTEHKISLSKQKTRGTAHPLSAGSKSRMAGRRSGVGMGNLGKISRGAMTKWKRFNKKTSKKMDLRYLCKVCNKASTQRNTYRAKKIEFQ